MERIVPSSDGMASAAQGSARRWPLYGSAASRLIEREAAAGLPPHTLMQRAGQAVARLARAWRPHARRVLVLTGGGNNGGDGWLAAALLKRHLRGTPGAGVRVWPLGPAARMPEDARWAWAEAHAAGVDVIETPTPPATSADLIIDAVFGLGLSRPVDGPARDILRWLHGCPVPTLCVDLPSGLDGDTGRWWIDTPPQPGAPRITLSLLTLKPGLFTGLGRACAGEAIWFDDLGVAPAPHHAPDAWLAAPKRWPDVPTLRQAHASHKGSRGDVVVVGGQLPNASDGIGMAGAAVLAARAALRAGAGRVYVGLLNGEANLPPWDSGQPALMLRTAQAVLASSLPERAVVVAGCGAGASMAEMLPVMLARAPRLVLDADALNALGPAAREGSLNETAPDALWAQRRAAGWCTVLTPHPLEAARLLGTDVAHVQADRLGAARALAHRLGATVVLKGSGTVIAAPDAPPFVNASGDGLLASAGTGDVLAGLIGARLAHGDADDLPAAVGEAVAAHGRLAQQWARDWPATATDLIA
ncbi:MAG: NAD(P)H-hydrate dehydratase [Tepidimonas sp.]|uniref:NAD(P)H-hydrate dehydratase n=1 Tax=Tepidimonas sp. TaxID=2002775 RepID=UPI00259DEC4E|nr:NAD(P)H-hydrate dehydratase [Tepidimonas sp.]MDM7456453.1 NAD(P)H-hydrate dehydratase [Tepidimonas sp.]